MKAFSLLIGLAILIFGTGLRTSDTVTVMIDAGHGGKDPGHLSHSEKHKTEKEINLLIANYLGGYVEKNLRNVTIAYTRTDDRFLTLDERVDLANAKNADYFISVHCNGNPKTTVYGTESHVHDFSATKSYNLAKDIETQFSTRAGRHSRGIKNNDDRAHSIQVLKFTKMTSVLVECGFLTNTAEANYLNTTHGQEIIASAIFRAIRSSVQRDFPEVKTNEETEEESTSFTIQLMSSKTWIDTDSPYFKKLNMEVKRVELNTTSAYKYIYYAGTFSTKAEANLVLEKVKQKGYKDALVVRKKTE